MFRKINDNEQFWQAACWSAIFLLEALADRASLDYFQHGVLALASLDCQTLKTRQQPQYLRRTA